MSSAVSRSVACATSALAGQRKSGWWDDYPASDFNFLSRFEELTKVTISRWANGDPGFAQVTLEDPDLFRCPFLKMQGAANYDFTPDGDRHAAPVLPQGRLPLGGRQLDRRRLGVHQGEPGQDSSRVPDCGDHAGSPSPLGALPRVRDPADPKHRIVAPERRAADEFGSGPPHLYAIFGENGRLMVLVSINCDTSDSWEREGDNPEFFQRFSPTGYTLGVNVAVWVMSH